MGTSKNLKQNKQKIPIENEKKKTKLTVNLTKSLALPFKDNNSREFPKRKLLFYILIIT